MTAPDPASSLSLESVQELRANLTDLIPKLQQVNSRFSEASKPLANLDDMNLEQREKLLNDIRAANQQWEEVALQIRKALALLQ